MRTLAANPSPSARPARATPIVVAGVDLRPAGVDDALRGLEVVAGRLRAAGDPRAVFPDVYAVVTRRVAEAVRDGGVFLDAAWVDRLAGCFAELYYDVLVPSLLGEAPAPQAWRVAFAAGEGTRLPVRDALLGINAHVNFDLARGVARVILERGAPDAAALARYKHDYDLINQLLATAVPDVFRALAERHRCPVGRLTVRSRAAEAVLSALALHTVARWRERVWADVLRLLHTDGSGQAAAVASLDGRSGRIALAFAASNPSWVLTRAAA